MNKEALLKASMPGIRDLFDMEYRKMNEKIQQQWNEQGDVK